MGRSKVYEKKIKIPMITLTLLSDNHSKENSLIAEHGFSILIETPKSSILFDTGQGHAVFENAKALNKDLSQVHTLVISHGHYDHGGGLKKLNRMNPQLNIICHSKVTTKRYSYHPDKGVKDISLTENDQILIKEKMIPYIHWTCLASKIDDHIYGTGEIPQNQQQPQNTIFFYVQAEEQKVDLFEDEISLWIEGKEGLTIITGCSHRGLVNTIEHILTLSQSQQIQTLIGGFHLSNKTNREILEIAKQLQNYDIKEIIPCHCSGEKAYSLFKQNLRSKVEQGYIGFIKLIEV